MAGLSATFRLIDEMSDKLDAIAARGAQMMNQLEYGGARVSESFSSVVDTVDSFKNAIGEMEALQNQFANSTEEAGRSNEQLEQAAANAANAATNLSSVLSETESIQNELSTAMNAASEAAQQLAENENVSVQAKEQLAQASSTAAEAMENLTAAQQEAASAMSAYEEMIASGTANLDELEAAAQRAGTAAENLASANGTAKSATEQLGKAVEEAGKQAEEAGKQSEDAGGKGTEAIESISSALAAAAITATLKEAAQYAYELAASFSEAEKTISSATGAVGDELAALESSAYDVYASNDDGLDRVAQLTSTVSVRFKETGDDLTDLTNRFLAFDDVCDTDVNAAVTSVTQTLNRWNMETDQADELMDKLTYAYQQTGASISGMMSTLLSGATYFQEMDMTLDGTITLLSEMEQQGISSTQVVTAMRTALTNFSADGLDAGNALRDVVEQIQNMESSSEATALAVETFGTRSGAIFADAIRNGTISVDTFTASMDEADGALDKMADTTETLDEKWQRAANNINSAFTKAVEPAVTKMSTGMSDFMNGIGDFLNENQGVTKGIVAATTAVGVFVGAFTLLGTTLKVVIPVIKELGAAINLNLGPIGWVAMAIGAVTTAIGVFCAMSEDAESEIDSLTASSREQYEELQSLSAEYEEACDRFGETSEQALDLKYEMDTLSEEFEANKKTTEEFEQELQNLADAYQETKDEFDQQIQSIDASEQSNLALIQRLSQLASTTVKTSGVQDEMRVIIDKLNDSIDGLSLSYDDLIFNQDNVIESIRAMAEAQADQERYQAAYDAYVDELQQQTDAENQLAEATADRDAAYRAAADYAEQHSNVVYINDDGKLAGNAHRAGNLSTEEKNLNADIDEANSRLEERQALLDEIDASVIQMESDFEELTEVSVEGMNDQEAAQTAVQEAIDSTKSSVTDLITAYNDAYEAAYSSVDGTIGLFDTMSTECETSTADMIAALQSQSEYLNTYTENIRKAAEYGIDEGLVESLSDGSQESAAYLDTIIQKIDELGGNTQAAQDFINQLNGSFSEVEGAKDTFAGTVAEMRTDFTTEMDGIQQEMQTTVENLDLSDEASTAAINSIQAYIDGIRSKKGEAVAAAESIVQATQVALRTSNQQTTEYYDPYSHSSGVSGHAEGTTNAEDIFVAGEEGPELIVGQSGSTVFPTSETDRIIDAVSRYVPLSVQSDGDSLGASGNDKTIRLEINGSGAMEIGDGVNKDEVVAIMLQNLKPVLMQIVQEEIYEEGDGSYEY